MPISTDLFIVVIDSLKESIFSLAVSNWVLILLTFLIKTIRAMENNMPINENINRKATVK